MGYWSVVKTSPQIADSLSSTTKAVGIQIRQSGTSAKMTYSAGLRADNGFEFDGTLSHIFSSNDLIRGRFDGYITETNSKGTRVYKTVYTNSFTAGGSLPPRVVFADRNPYYYFNGYVYLEKYISTPPTTPSSISVPATIKGGDSFTVSWGSGSDATSYYLERSVNGGSYTQIYSGSSRSRTETTLSTWNTVSYRVRSYNSDGFSGYKTSSTTTITWNTAPTTPSSITVPELKSGKPATISWGSSTDADGDTINYYLYRSINGGSFSTIRSGGTTRSYSDTPDKSWSTVIYRVRAYDGQTYSSYRTSSTITVKHFPEMKLKVDGTLKTSDDGWVRINGELRKIDGIWIRTNGILKEV